MRPRSDLGDRNSKFSVTVFDVREIEEWIDGGQTALCPHCGIDSVLPVIDGHPDVAFLWAPLVLNAAPALNGRRVQYMIHSEKTTPVGEV
jgi:hypothetical protein